MTDLKRFPFKVVSDLHRARKVVVVVSVQTRSFTVSLHGDVVPMHTQLVCIGVCQPTAFLEMAPSGPTCGAHFF